MCTHAPYDIDLESLINDTLVYIIDQYMLSGYRRSKFRISKQVFIKIFQNLSGYEFATIAPTVTFHAMGVTYHGLLTNGDYITCDLEKLIPYIQNQYNTA